MYVNGYMIMLVGYVGVIGGHVKEVILLNMPPLLYRMINCKASPAFIIRHIFYICSQA